MGERYSEKRIFDHSCIPMKNINRFKSVLYSVSAALALLLASEAAAENAPSAVRISHVSLAPNGQAVFSGIAGVVAHQGWLEKELNKRGVRLEWMPLSHQAVGPLTNEGLASGKIDIAARGDLPAVIGSAGGIKAKLIVPGGAGSDVYVYVRPDSEAKSLKDLKGKKIALHRGRPWEAPFARGLELSGLKLNQLKVINLNPQAGASALISGDVDAFVSVADHSLLKRGVAKELWSTKRGPADTRLRMDLWASDAFLSNYPEITQLVVKAWIQAAHWSSQEQNRDEFIRISARTGVPEQWLRQDYEDSRINWKDRWSPVPDKRLLEHYKYLVRQSVDTKLIRTAYDFTPYIDVRYVNAALKELNLEQYWNAAQLTKSPK